MSDCIDHGRKGFGMGYATAWVKDPSGKKITTTLHRKVHYDATGQWPEVVRHTCDNARCINHLHLVSGTQLDNVKDMDNRKRRVQGNDSRKGDERGYGSKITDADAQYIRDNIVMRDKEFGVTPLARKFGISIAQVSRIVHGIRR